MPGICGIFDPEGNSNVAEVLSAMAGRMRFYARYRDEKFVDAEQNVGIGRTTLGVMSPEVQPERAADGRFTAVMEGELYRADDDDERSDLGMVLGAVQAGPQALRALNGSYVCAVWDKTDKTLVLLNDRFGMRPVYYTSVGGRFLFSSNLAALLVDPGVSREPSKAGIAQFLTYGQYLSEDTSLEAIKVLPAGATLRFDGAKRTISIEKYWRPSVADTHARSESEWLELISESFANAVKSRVGKSGGVGIALSGGLDARSILALADQSNDPITAICYSMRGSLDHRCSEHMSRIAGNPYHHYELGTEFLSDYRRHLEQMVLLTDGQYLSQCIVMPTLPLYEQHGIEVLLRGHAGEMMHMHKAYAYTLDDEALNAKTGGEIERWLMSHLQAYMLDSVDGPLLMPQFQSALEQAPREALKRELNECSPASPPVQTVWELFISARLRRETSLSMAKFSSTVDIRLPYLDNELIDLLLMAPPELKMGDTIQAHILRTRRPEFLDVINANTGAKIGAPKIVQQFSSLKKRVLGKLGVPGYQPYERLGLWLRREIAPTVHEVLLTDQCKSRGVFEPDALERVVNNHMAGKANSTYLLMALMIIELGQRYLNGEEGFAAHSV